MTRALVMVPLISLLSIPWSSAADDRGATAEMLHNLGNAARDRGRLERAAECYQKALELRQPFAPESLEVAEVLHNLGLVALERAQIERADDYFRQALEIRERWIPESLEVARSLYYLGKVAYYLDDLHLAQGYLQQALAIEEKLGPGSVAMAGTLLLLGEVTAERNERELAEHYHQRLVQIVERLAPESLPVADLLNDLGRTVRRRGEPERAWETFQRALAISQKLAPGGLEEARIFSSLGMLAASRGEGELAEQHLQRALEITKKRVPGSLEMARIFGRLAAAGASSRGELEQKRLYLERALEIRERLAPDGFELAGNLRSLGNVARKQGELHLAAQYLDRSLKIREILLGKLRSPHHVKTSFWGVSEFSYRSLVEILLNINRPEQAFANLERLRARGFLEATAERELLPNADIPSEMQQARRRIAIEQDRIQRQLTKLDPQQEAERISQLRREFQRLRRERDDVNAQIRRTSLPWAAVASPQPLDLRGTRESLDPGTVMLYYDVDWTRSDLFVITRENGLEVHSLPLGKYKLLREVEVLRQLIAQARPDLRTGSDFTAALERISRRLGRALIEPAAERVAQSRRVLIVPNGPLHLLPFGALIIDRGADQALTGRDWHYLAEWKPLHSVLSATVYAELRGSRPRPGRDRDHAAIELAAFGDPYYPPDLRQHRDEIADVDLRAAVERGLTLEPLPSTRQEVEGIAGFYPSDASRIYLGPEATEEHAKAAGRDIRYLHFATHAVLDPHLPLNSGLVLSIPGQSGEGRDNGLLQVWEILDGLRFDAELVVLSACGSALGQEEGGEGLIGLTRAFQIAGARSVAATLWQVDDRITAELMVRFHRHLSAGRSKDEALRAAQLELIRAPIRVRDETGQVRQIDASAPHYWAAFQIFGDWR